MNDKIEKAFGEQVNAELYSAYLYLSMSNWFERQNLEGMARWMRLQWSEEQEHALKLVEFIHNRGGKVVLTQIDAPKSDWTAPLDVFEEALEHERKVSGLISDLVELAVAEHDHAAHALLQWFVSEQVEEEATVETIVEKLRMIGEHGAALLMMDAQLGQRQVAPAGESS